VYFKIIKNCLKNIKMENLENSLKKLEISLYDPFTEKVIKEWSLKRPLKPKVLEYIKKLEKDTKNKKNFKIDTYYKIKRPFIVINGIRRKYRSIREFHKLLAEKNSF